MAPVAYPMRVVEPRSMTPISRTGSRAAKFGWEMASAKITIRTSGREAKGGKRYLEEKKEVQSLRFST